MEYHLSIAGERSGPHSQFYLIEGIREGKLTGDELVWQKGQDEWKPLRTLNEFDGYWPVPEETLAQAEAARALARSSLDRPQPWLRFWARLLDYVCFFLVLGFLLRAFVPSDPQVWLTVPVLKYVPWDSIMMLLYVPVEAFMLSQVGTTPGRALLRIQVRRLDGGLPLFSQALRRSFQVFLKGLALGLPLVYLLAMAWWRLNLLQKGVTPWDEANETRVEHGEPEIWRFLVLGGVILGILVTVVLVGGRLAEEMSRLPK